MEIKEFQNLIRKMYYDKDAGRGLRETFTWFIEEIGELSRAMRTNKNIEAEFADVCAWLFSIANIKGIDIEQAVKRYANGCPKCGKLPCICEV